MARNSGIKAADTVITVTPTLDTSAYADNDLMADTTAIPSAVLSNGSSVLLSMSVIDKDDKGGGLEIVFLRSNTTMGTINSGPSMTDANSAEILGYLSVASSDYTDLGGFQVATVDSVGLLLEPTSGTSVYFAVISDGNTETYTASGLVFKFGLLRS